MCLGIPGRIVEVLDVGRCLCLAEVSGVRREVNVAPVLEGEISALVGRFVLIHVGFAMSVIDEAEAARTLEALRDLGEAQETLAQMSAGASALAGPGLGGGGA